LALLVVADSHGSGEVRDEENSFALGEKVRRALPPHWTCVSVKVVPRLPRTANGKIARSALVALL
jgi:acyl-coenzyme A synthetase/AMP-(fatty) acid ligase